MKNIIYLLALTFIIASCGASKTDEMPQDVESMKNVLRTKESTLVELKKEIRTLKEEIIKLDPDFEKKEIAVVELIAIEKKDFKHYVEVQGSIDAGESIMISSEMPGTIVSLKVKEGSWVSKGQLLATIDSESIQKSIDELKTALGLATDIYERQKRLWDQNIGSEIQYLQARNNKERFEKSLESAKTSLKKTRIYSPLSGTVARLMTKKGELASPGIPIMHVISIKKVKIKADVPEVYLRDIKRKDLVKVSVPVLDFEKEVPVCRVGQIINFNNRTFEVEVRMDNPNNEFKPNLLAIIHVNDYSAEDAISIPLELLQQDVSGNNFVFVAEQNEEGKHFVRKRMIETGMAYDSTIEILSGLEGSEMLVTTGAQYLAEGEEVKVKGE